MTNIEYMEDGQWLGNTYERRAHIMFQNVSAYLVMSLMMPSLELHALSGDLG
jgi:hypothetical protein